MRVDIMVDIETLGVSIDSTIIQIAAMAFDIETGKIIDSFDRIADITKNEDYEMNVSGKTLIWWLNTDKELLAKTLNNGNGSSARMLEDFHLWLNKWQPKVLHLWGKGILFDNNIIRHQFEKIGLEYPIFFRNDRDVRTIMDLACAKLGITEKELMNKYYDPGMQPHDAYNDVVNQIALVVGCYKELTEVSNG